MMRPLHLWGRVAQMISTEADISFNPAQTRHLQALLVTPFFQLGEQGHQRAPTYVDGAVVSEFVDGGAGNLNMML